MAGYTRDFLIEVAVHRYLCLGSEAQAQDRKICEVTYDKFGKDKFRDLACVTPQAIRDYKAYLKNV
jgi:hypothetical protein